MSLSLHEALKAEARNVAAFLVLPLAWEGDVFILPAGPYLKGRIVYEEERAAACGTYAPIRIDGNLELTVAMPAGTAEAESRAIALARQVSACFPRGRGLDCEGGEAVFVQPAVLTIRTDSARILVTARMAFYAILRTGDHA